MGKLSVAGVRIPLRCVRLGKQHWAFEVPALLRAVLLEAASSACFVSREAQDPRWRPVFSG